MLVSLTSQNVKKLTQQEYFFKARSPLKALLSRPLGQNRAFRDFLCVISTCSPQAPNDRLMVTPSAHNSG